MKRAVAQMHARGKAANVLDIGTGTGLLSMMAAACGADSVTACEVRLELHLQRKIKSWAHHHFDSWAHELTDALFTFDEYLLFSPAIKNGAYPKGQVI